MSPTCLISSSGKPSTISCNTASWTVVSTSMPASAFWMLERAGAAAVCVSAAKEGGETSAAAVVAAAGIALNVSDRCVSAWDVCLAVAGSPMDSSANTRSAAAGVVGALLGAPPSSVSSVANGVSSSAKRSSSSGEVVSMLVAGGSAGGVRSSDGKSAMNDGDHTGAWMVASCEAEVCSESSANGEASSASLAKTSCASCANGLGKANSMRGAARSSSANKACSSSASAAGSAFANKPVVAGVCVSVAAGTVADDATASLLLPGGMVIGTKLPLSCMVAAGWLK